jgi:hypothetical protein
MGEGPWGLPGLNYFWGWARAAALRLPRAEPDVRDFVRKEELRDIRRMVESGRFQPPR